MLNPDDTVQENGGVIYADGAENWHRNLPLSEEWLFNVREWTM
ncbi:MAG: hypothetical protein R3E84_10155 [Pseudomonadales bacterium]